MYFKKIEMIGFKSFADRTVIEFNGGFTAIVGPNGCGKSNVSDAIRWVLGEQSAKSLRGDNMQDVIFKGTEKRKSLSYCEVTLTFDNTDRFFNIAYDELSITRKLYRSGESEYLINKNTCRLRDITDLLFDSGIGKNGYSVIGQGKVSEIVDEKPEDRRAMFEEAAGIAKFKSRKDEAERKLERTRDNLVRIDDIRAEIDRQMGPLRKQAEDAKKYLPNLDVESYKLYINPTGRFEKGGPAADTGLTGRKIIVDTYGGYAAHGGGAFSGKDPTKVDRSAAYAARWVAKNIVAAGMADKCQVQLAYAIGIAKPVSIRVDTFGTGKYSDMRICNAVEEVFDLTPQGIINRLDLRKPIYRDTAAYGHFGSVRGEERSWEKTDMVEALKEAIQ